MYHSIMINAKCNKCNKCENSQLVGHQCASNCKRQQCSCNKQMKVNLNLAFAKLIHQLTSKS